MIYQPCVIRRIFHLLREIFALCSDSVVFFFFFFFFLGGGGGGVGGGGGWGWLISVYLKKKLNQYPIDNETEMARVDKLP